MNSPRKHWALFAMDWGTRYTRSRHIRTRHPHCHKGLLLNAHENSAYGFHHTKAQTYLCIIRLACQSDPDVHTKTC